MKQHKWNGKRIAGRVLCLLLILALLPLAAFAAQEPEHVHRWSEAWTNDGAYHWHQCMTDDCTVTQNENKSGYGAHVFDDDADAFCNVCNFEREIEPSEDENITFQLPFTTTVVQKGSVAPGKMAFQYEMVDFGSEATIGGMAILSNTIMTEDAGDFEGRIRFTVKESLLGDLSEGFYVRQTVGTEPDWTYASEVWYVMPLLREGTWAFYKVIDGEVQFNDPQDGMNFTNIYENNEIFEDHEVTVDVPVTKIVEQTGNVAPGKQTFAFEIYDFGVSGAEESVSVTANTIETDGKGTFTGKIRLTMLESALSGNDPLAEGFFVREKKGTAAGWTYSDEIWYALPDDGEWIFCRAVNGEVQYNEPQKVMSFTNRYNENAEEKPAASEKPETPETPKTGEESRLGLWTSLLIASAAGVLGTIRLGKKRKQTMGE